MNTPKTMNTLKIKKWEGVSSVVWALLGCELFRYWVGHYGLLMVLCGLFAAVSPAFSQTWTQTSAPNNYWNSIASSADGTKLVAAVYGGGIYTSTNSGATWTLTSAPHSGFGAAWESVASSADGCKLVAAGCYNNPIYISTNSGMNWSSSGQSENWQSVACSADGSKLVAAASINGPIFTSTNFGTTWEKAGALSNWWQSVASSADGNKLVAAVGGSGPAVPIYVSTNAGTTWVETAAPQKVWVSVASSADGTKLVAVPGGLSTPQYPSTIIFTSTNSGATWVPRSVPSEYWWSVASSADGAKLIAVSYLNSFSSVSGSSITGGIFTSTNSGATWTQIVGPSNYWWSVASSADGNSLVGAVSGGGIYSSKTTPTPQLNLKSSTNGFYLSWLVPSTNFVLQQNLDLTTANWVTLTNTPTLNLTNLQDVVALLPTNSIGFYRLATP
jgi:hypothetical protein